MRFYEEIRMSRNNQEVKKIQKFGNAELRGWSVTQQSNGRIVRPDFLHGEGTDSVPYRLARDYRNTRPKYLRPWESWTGASISKRDYLVPEMKELCGHYYSEIVNSGLAKNFRGTLDRWWEMAHNYASIAQPEQKRRSSPSTPEERGQAFEMLAVMVDRFQDMRCRLKEPALDETMLGRACQQFETSKGTDCRAFFAICDRLVVTEGRYNGVSGHSSILEGPSEKVKMARPDVINTASDNLVKIPTMIMELGKKEEAIEKLLYLKGIEEKNKCIQIEYGMNKEIFEEIQSFGKDYEIIYDGIDNYIRDILDKTKPIYFEIKEKKVPHELMQRKVYMLEEYSKHLGRLLELKDQGTQEMVKAYERNCDIESSLNKDLDEIKQFIEDIDIGQEQHTQEKGLPRFAKDELVSQAKQLEKSLRRRRDTLRDVLVEQAQMLGKFESFYNLEHQRYEYQPEPNRAVFNQMNEPICISICTAMQVADQMSRKKGIEIAKKAFPDVEYSGDETMTEIVRKSVEDIKYKRGDISFIGSTYGDEILAINKFLAPIDKKYVWITNVKDDALQYFIQASTVNEKRGSIQAIYNHKGRRHGIVIDSKIIVEREERVNVRCPSKGPFACRMDLVCRNFDGGLLIPEVTWQEYVKECEVNNEQVGAVQLEPDPSSLNNSVKCD